MSAAVPQVQPKDAVARRRRMRDSQNADPRKDRMQQSLPMTYIIFVNQCVVLKERVFSGRCPQSCVNTGRLTLRRPRRYRFPAPLTIAIPQNDPKVWDDYLHEFA
jgi:hypothetical protein